MRENYVNRPTTSKRLKSRNLSDVETQDLLTYTINAQRGAIIPGQRTPQLDLGTTVVPVKV